MVLGVVMIIAGVLAVSHRPGRARDEPVLRRDVHRGRRRRDRARARDAHPGGLRVEAAVGHRDGCARRAVRGVSVAGIATLALLVGALLLANGVCSVMLALRVRPERDGAGCCSTAYCRSSRRDDRRRMAGNVGPDHRPADGFRADLRRRLADRAVARAARGRGQPPLRRRRRYGAGGAAAWPCARSASSDAPIVSACGSILTCSSAGAVRGQRALERGHELRGARRPSRRCAP